MCVYKESGGDSEVDSASKAAGDARIVDVTNEFVGCQDIIDSATQDGSSVAECSHSTEPVPSSPPAAHCQETDPEAEGLNEAVSSICIQDDPTATSPVEVAVVIGGMDTNGEIFDDCLVFRLTT